MFLSIAFRSEEVAHLMVYRDVWHELYGRNGFQWVDGLNT